MSSKKNVDLIEALFKKYRSTIYKMAMSIMKDEHDANDVVQLVMIKIMKNMDKIDDINSARCKHFILVITKNTALTEISKTKREKIVTMDPIQLVGLSGVQIDFYQFEENYGFSQEVMQFLEELRETDKDILCLKYGSEYSDKEIGEILEIEETAVRKRLSRARMRLSQLLQEKGKRYE